MKTFIRTQNSLRAAAALLLAIFFAAGCQYTTTADGGVHMELNGQSSITDLMPSWDMTYKDGALTSADSNSSNRFRPITTAQDELEQACLRELGLGYGDDENIVDLSELYSDTWPRMATCW